LRMMRFAGLGTKQLRLVSPACYACFFEALLIFV